MGKKLFSILLVILAIISQSFAKNRVNTAVVLTDSIIIISPNGGENWQAGTTQTITWTSDINDNVRIELYQGGTFYSVIVASTSNDGSYSWSIPPGTAITDRYKISVESTVDPSNFDLSDEDFTISSPDIMVTSPNGGEMWQAGQTHIITWNDDLVEQVKIELYRNGSLYFPITSSTPSDGSHPWLIPYSFEGGSAYKIKISSTQFTTKFDYSDSNFTITPNEITITSPINGTNWHAGTIHQITWDANFNDNVSINLLKGGSLFRILSSSTGGISFNWVIPFDEIGGSDYQIRVGSIINSAVNDTSDFFTITANQINITSPNGGEVWYTDSTHQITWTHNITGNVKIELMKNDNFNSLITSSTPSTGAFDWNIPSTVQPGIDYRIKITAINSNNVFDISDTNFTIINLPIITSPNGGENWQLGSNHAITWIDNLSGNIEIDLWKGGVFYAVIDASDPSDGVFNWSIPDSLEPDIDYRIKITSRQDTNSFDFSDNDFILSRGQIFITRPNGGEYWLLGTNEDIIWDDNFGGNVKIELYKTGTYFLTVDPTTPADGSFRWNIPETIPPGTDYQIRITSFDDSTITDLSDTTFSLDFPQIQITEPNGGEKWRIGSTYSITWEDFITENVKIELHKADTLYYEISAATPSDGQYNWKVPIEIEEGSDYKLMIGSISNTNIIDFSDNNFSILAVPADFELQQNFPNPFNLTTVIRYGIPEDGVVLLDVFDVTGQKILTLVNKEQARGFYEVPFYTGDLPSGIYLYRIVSGKFIQLKKMILTK